MKLVPVDNSQAAVDKWIHFYKHVLPNRPTTSQRGYGGSLVRNRGRGESVTVPDIPVPNIVVTPTEQVVQQAKSEIKQRRAYKSPGDNIQIIAKTPAIKRAKSIKKTIRNKSKKTPVKKAKGVKKVSRKSKTKPSAKKKAMSKKIKLLKKVAKKSKSRDIFTF